MRSKGGKVKLRRLIFFAVELLFCNVALVMTAEWILAQSSAAKLRQSEQVAK